MTSYKISHRFPMGFFSCGLLMIDFSKCFFLQYLFSATDPMDFFWISSLMLSHSVFFLWFPIQFHMDFLPMMFSRTSYHMVFPMVSLRHFL